MLTSQLCSDELAFRARKLAQETKTTHHVIDVSFPRLGKRKAVQKIVSDPINHTAEEGIITVLYTAHYQAKDN